jgi:hypothetical protein
MKKRWTRNTYEVVKYITPIISITLEVGGLFLIGTILTAQERNRPQLGKKSREFCKSSTKEITMLSKMVCEDI